MCSSSMAFQSAAKTFGFDGPAAVAPIAKPKPGQAVSVACPCKGSAVPQEASAAIADSQRLVEAHCALEQRCRHNTAALDPARGAIPDAEDVPEGEAITPFHSRTVPGLSLSQLGAVMAKATATLEHTQWMTLVLFARYCESADVPPSNHMMHRLYVACMHLAVKTHDDRFFSNAHFARLAGVLPSEMNALESALLRGLKWRVLVTSDHVTALAVDPSEYFASLIQMRPRVAMKAGDVELDDRHHGHGHHHHGRHHSSPGAYAEDESPSTSSSGANSHGSSEPPSPCASPVLAVNPERPSHMPTPSQGPLFSFAA